MPTQHLALAKKFEGLLLDRIGDPLLYAPSIQVSVLDKGQVRFRWGWGEEFAFYDLASLTKIIFSALAWMNLLKKTKMSLSDSANIYLPWWRGGEGISLHQLLTHSGGVCWWKPYYKTLGKKADHEMNWLKLKSLLAKEQPLKNSGQSVYSDLDLFYLGFVAEELFQKDLFQIWEDVANRFDFKNFHFQNQNRFKHKRSDYAPTELSAWRGRRLQGEVHDDNAYSLGGIAPHAGLFGQMEDVERYLLVLRQILLQGGFGFLSSDLKPFVSRQTPRALGDFGYIFMKPTKGASSSGRFFDDSSFGHTGFTGTSLWYSPKKDRGVIILSNRVYYGSDHELFRHLRPLIHDLVIKVLEEM